MMRLQREGMSLWYGTPDANAPSDVVQTDTEVAITVGVQPVDTSNSVELHYRINRGPTKTVNATWVWNHPSGEKQYFRATLPASAFRDGDTVEYVPLCRCAGRQIPSHEETVEFTSSFRVVGPDVESAPVVASEARSLLEPNIVNGSPEDAIASVTVASSALSPMAARGEGSEGPHGPVGGPKLELTITEPVEGARVPMGNVTIKGTRNPSAMTVGWKLKDKSGAASPVGQAGWSASVPIDTRGEQIIEVTGYYESATHIASTHKSLKVTVFDGGLPSIVVEQPQPEVSITKPLLVVRAKAPKSGVKGVRWNLNAPPTRNAAREGDKWIANIVIPSSQVPRGGTPYTLNVSACNLDDVCAEQQMQFTAIDNTPPQLQIVEPPAEPPDANEIPGTAEGAIVELRGTASDSHNETELHSGVEKVEWRLDDEPFELATPQAPGDWSNWSASVRIPPRDKHIITVRCTDKEGNTTLATLSVVAALPFEVKDLLFRSYLKDLLTFAEQRLVQKDGASVDEGLFARTFHQPFAELVSTISEEAHQQVHQVRVCIEVLRGYLVDRPLSSGAAEDLAKAEAEYRKVAYQALLSNVGTSYEEIRLARVADDETREALANRLGIELSPTRPDQLDSMFLQLEEVTEAALERLFGFRASTHSPLETGPTTTPELLSWQSERLRTLWRQEDRPPSTAAEVPPPIIDPDMIGPDDFRNPLGDDPAFELWEVRQEEVSGWIKDLRAKRGSRAEPLQAFDHVVGGVLASLNLPDLAQKRKDGTKIEVARDGVNVEITVEDYLEENQLSLAVFDYLVRIRNLAAAGTVLATEWEDVYSILAQVLKLRRYGDWREEQRLKNLSLGPDHFKIPAQTEPPLELPVWRATERARRDWQGTLRARIDQQQSIAQALSAAVDATEEATLPLLRDGLVTTIGTGHTDIDVADALTQRLLIDVKANGYPRTTRTAQAIETLHGILFSMRAGHFKEKGSELGPNPAAEWQLVQSPDYREEHFDQEFRWMGSYEAWRAAMFAFFYPENVLLPSLREDSTQAFRVLVTSLRGEQGLTPERAREAASEYLRDAEGTVWIEDTLPAGATPNQPSNGREPWSWVTSDPLPFSGVRAHQSSLNSLTHQHFFEGATVPLQIWPGDTLYAYVYLDPDNTPAEVMLQWHDGTWWDHRAYWGDADRIGWGLEGTASRRRMGPLPPAGEWVRLEVPADQVGLEGKTVSGMAFTLYGGRATWDRAGRWLLPPEITDRLSIIDQLSEDELASRSATVSTLYDTASTLYKANKLPEEALTYLREAFYFVPIHLALQLQQSGEYLAALDWFQTVYAYNLPAGQRKIYESLELDPDKPGPVNRTVQWLLNSLNPHRVGATRANAYTRFTLLSVARCFLEHADAEFTHDTDESLPKARALYMNTLDLLDSPEIRQASGDATPASDTFSPNPVPESLRRHAELSLLKLRTGRNFAGMQRQVEPIVQEVGSTDGLPTVDSSGRLVVPGTVPSRPTPYRYSVLIERAKQFVALSQQVEAAYLSTLERADAENYSLLEADHALNLARANVDLQKLREKEAVDSEELANRQKSRSQLEASTYDEWLQAGFNKFEMKMLEAYRDAKAARNHMAIVDAALTAAQALTSASSGGLLGTGIGGGYAGVGLVTTLATVRAGYTELMNNAEFSAQQNAFYASHERSRDQWKLQKSLAEKDVWISDQQIQLARDQLLVVQQERSIAQTQSDQAKAVADFLANKFTNAELYEWMSGVLRQIYGYFLRQSTALAQLAQNQLAFERQEVPPSFIQADYWQPPSETGALGATGEEQPDRRGLTGSARLLEDVYRLDQYAFETNKRKLQLTQTFSLAQLAPFEFQQFRETGVLPFTTPMELFDRVFPGHYLRLIHQVRTSVVALVPPTHGIKATLSTSGVSRVVTGGEVFQNVVVRRDPETIALSSPANATGLFELDPQSEMLRPFEAMGVDTFWQFQMPKAANPFDYRTIADVLITIEYTALNSNDYRQQVIQSLDTDVRADRPFTFRQQFPDQWYDLHNPEQAAMPMVVRFSTVRDDFPPNVEDLRIKHLVLYFIRSDGVMSEVEVDHLYLYQDNARIEAGGANSIDGIISTRGGNGASWTPIIGAVPIGEWELALNEQARPQFEQEKVEDIILIITYSGRVPEWPA